MELIVEKKDGSTFSIEADTVLGVKRKIEMSQGIPVSDQKVFFQGTLLEEDDLDLNHYKIVRKSRLHLFFSPKPNHHKDQVLHQTEQSSAPSKLITDIFQNQDSTVTAMSNNDQVPPPVHAYSFEEFINDEDSSLMMARRNDDQVLNQTQKPPRHVYSFGELFNSQDSTTNDQTTQSPVQSYSFEEIFNSQDWSVMERSNEDQVQGFWPVTTEENVNVQDSWGRSNKNQDYLQREPYPPSNLIGDFMYDEDTPLSAEHFTDIQSFLPESASEGIISNKNQVLPSNSTEERINTQNMTVNVGSRNLQTEKSPPVKEVVNIRDSPVKMIRSAQKPPRTMRVMMLPYSRESKAVQKFPMNVDPFKNVKELRKELEKIQQQRSDELNLPEKGYFFIHKQRVLDDDQSFRSNGVAPGDTIEIFPGYVTHDGQI